jgi:hypothetical protein
MQIDGRREKTPTTPVQCLFALLHGSLHLFRPSVRQGPRAEQRKKVVTLQTVSGWGVDVRLISGGKESRLQFHSRLLECGRQGVIRIRIHGRHNGVNPVLLCREGRGREVDAAEGHRGVEDADLPAACWNDCAVWLADRADEGEMP